MSDINVDVNDVPAVKTTELTQADVVAFIANVKTALNFAKGFAAMTPTQVDDKAIASVENFIKMVEPVITEPWFAKLVDSLMHLVMKTDHVAVKEALMKINAAM